MNRKLCWILFIFVVQGCAPSTQQISKTPSGHPERIFENVSVETLHDEMINSLLKNDWRLTNNNNANIIVVRNMEASRAAGERFSSSVLRGEKGAQYYDEVDYALINTGNGVRVIARLNTVAEYQSGRTSRYANTWDEVYNEIQSWLNNQIR